MDDRISGDWIDAAAKRGGEWLADRLPAEMVMPTKETAVSDFAAAFIDIIREEYAKHVPGWRPIESAPKDGTHVLLWWPYWSSRGPVVGWWQVNGGWQSEVAISEGDGPANWMPLPSPPPQE